MAEQGGAEQYAQSRKYDYRANSSLVLAAENRTRDAHEPTGEPETLHGKMVAKMGDRVQHGKPEQLEQRKSRSKKRQEAEEQNLGHQITKKSQKSRQSTILDVGADGAIYHPKTKETRQAYELLLNSLSSFEAFQDQTSDLLKAVADEVLITLKNDRMKDPEKQVQIEEYVGQKLEIDRFSFLVKVGKMITDFKPQDDDDILMDQQENAAETGVAVQLDDSEDEEGSELDEIAEESEDEEFQEAENGQQEMNDVKEDIKGPMDVDQAPQKRSNLINVKEIDAYWLQRQVRDAIPDMDPDEAQKLANQIYETLVSPVANHSELESQLVLLLSYDKFDLIRLLISNRDQIVWTIRLQRTQDDTERQAIEQEMMDRPELRPILSALRATRASARERQDAMKESIEEEARLLQAYNSNAVVSEQNQNAVAGRTQLDLDQLAFSQGGRLNSNKRLQSEAYQVTEKNFIEIQIPPLKPRPMDEKEELVMIKDMPTWTQAAFQGMTQLNRIQSKVYQTALFTSKNLLMCAPTGAGKTNVAMLTILREISQYRNEDGSINLSEFKIIYVAPMKALVAEMVGNFSNRLKEYNVRVEELTGDVNMSKQQIDQTQVIVTTPEKWDIISRKSGDRTFTNMVKLVIIDEVHLLHDDRGPVIESIVARTVRQIESTHEMVRLVGLSATLPNYGDVAGFLRVEKQNLFYFDNSYRPVPLAQFYVGVKVKKPLQRFQVMNEICYKKVIENAGQHQILIFVHSRKETAKTAKFLKEEAMKEGTIGQIMRSDGATTEILREYAETARNTDLKELLPFGFGIHHAGMSRQDRKDIVEDLFANGAIQVLVSTATLAWGVNLPAHTVIIKGTQVYDPTACKWNELSAIDTMQMLGRAGRPQYDSQGTGIIITQQQELLYYASLFNQKLPIESHFIKTVPDNLNAEIVLGTVSNIKEGAQWLGYTYLYVRMLKSPQLYGVPIGAIEDDPTLQERRMDIIHTAATILDRHNLIKYDRRSGSFFITDIGRIASHYYVTHTTMHTFNEHMKSTMGEVELLRLFSLADEFKNMIVREEEKLELAKLIERVPIPIKDSIEEPTAKTNVLLQAYISRLQLDGLALSSDMVYVTQSAGRIMRCLFEICLRRGWANLTEKALNLCKMINRRMWLSQTPLRQFGAELPPDVLQKIERKDISWENYLKLQPTDLGELFRKEGLGKVLFKLIHRLPNLQLSPYVQPITRNLIQIDLTITPDFQWNERISGQVEPFWIIVEDQDSEKILHYQSFMLRKNLMDEDHVISFTVPITEPLPPQYFVRVVSDRWLQCDSTIPVSFRHLILPEKSSAVTELIDLQPVPVSALKNPNYEKLYKHFTYFNPIQTQVFTTLYDTDDNFLVAAPVGSGKTICAEFAILRMITRAQQGKCVSRCVYVAPFQAVADQRYRQWQAKFGDQLGLTVSQLTGETMTTDFKLLEKANIIVTIPEHWDVLSRRWKRRKVIQQLALFIVDELHLLTRPRIGSVIEAITTRMRYIAAQSESPVRIVGLSTSCATARDVGDWIGASSRGLFNFDAAARPVPLEVHIQGFDIQNFESRMQAMSRPTYIAINNLAEGDKPVVIFVPTRKHVSMLVLDLLTYAATDEETNKFLLLKDGGEVFENRLSNVRDPALKHSLNYGIGFLHEAMSSQEQAIVHDLMAAQAIQVVVATAGTCWAMDIYAHLTIIMGTQYYDAVGLGGNDYGVPDLLQMIGRSSRYGVDKRGKCVIMCHTARKEYYKRFLFDPYPVESVLEGELNDHFNAEIVNKTIENMQEAFDYLTWTFFYRRMAKNPNFYGMVGVSHRQISDHLSELVEKTLSELKESQVISIWDEMEVSPLNLGMIAEHYYIHYTTIEIFRRSLTPRTRLKGLLDILSNASEFHNVLVRPAEENLIKNILTHAPIAVSNTSYSQTSVKINALLQAYFSRSHVGGDMLLDQRSVVAQTVRLLHAMVDVISSDLQWLNLVIQVMELCQMVVQGMWNRDSELLQLPHFTKDLAQKCKQVANVETVFDLVEMNDEQRNSILQLSDRQMQQIIRACNRYPDIEMFHELVIPEESQAENKGGVIGGSPILIQVQLRRQVEDDLPPVESQRFPKRKDEQWWLVIGEPSPDVNTLYAIRKLTVKAETSAKLEFEAPKSVGEHKLTLYFMCDSYLGCDQEYNITLNVTEEAEDKMEV